MMRALAAIALVLLFAGPALAQLPHPGLRPPMPPAPETTPQFDPSGLDCKGCHIAEHRGVVQMYLGGYGRGVPTIPSTMSQARVECVGCHVTPKEDPTRAGLIGQTFRTTEEACVRCHGEKYRGMLTRWRETLPAIDKAVADRITAARVLVDAAGNHPQASTARKMLDDADFNARFVALARGAHNPFYSGALLLKANEWVDSAATLVGKPKPGGEHPLARGNYCAVLCHEPLGLKIPQTVTFRGRVVPHARHATELGASCTSCHSAVSHKKMTVTAATCSGCHHAPQNDKCESCHKEQSAFYQGRTKSPLATVAPNLMAGSVPCTGCHDFARPRPRAAIGETCTACHEASYLPLLAEWTTGYVGDIKSTEAAVRAAESALASARKAGRKTGDAPALVKQAREAVATVRAARPAHNPLAAESLLAAARSQAERARTLAGGR